MIKKRFNPGSRLIAKVFFVIITLGIFAAIVTGVYALTTGNIPAINPGHNSTQIYISIGSGNYITLQDALNGGYLVGASVSSIPHSSLPSSTPYELASKVLITVGGYNVTLQNATDHELFATPSNAQNYMQSSIPSGGEYASNVNVNTINGVKNFQYAIANSLLSPCLAGQHWINPNGCVSNNVGQSCTPAGLSAGCVSGYTIQIDGSCGGSGAPSAFGTSCGSNVGCDGSGHCVGYSGSGCGACPFGITHNGNCGNSNTLCRTCPNGDYNCANHWGGFNWRTINWALVCSYQTCDISGCSDNDVSWNIYPGGPNADPQVRIC